MIKKFIKSIIYSCMLLTGIALYMGSVVPDALYFTQGQDISIKSLPMISFRANSSKTSTVSSSTGGINYDALLLGVFPIKTVTVTTTNERYVNVSGEPFGIKMFSDGVMVVGFSDILTSTGYQNPAKLVGLKIGDVILSMNDELTKSKEDVENIIKKSNQNPIKVTYLRDEKENTTILIPVFDTSTNTYRSGMWVRDSSAGIGTMTFYDVNKGLFAGLGHGIKDVDTQKNIRLLSGEIVPVKITGLVKSKDGSAGELKGTFLSSFASGKVLLNKDSGVYGKAFNTKSDNLMPVATPQEITTGKAYIYTTLNGTTPKQYEIEIEKVSLTAQNQDKNMVIRITDPELLALTGGIVQGMSGSPIVQNGKLVGAVTHVFVNQVTRGYGIFAQNMITTLDSIDNLQLQNVA